MLPFTIDVMRDPSVHSAPGVNKVHSYYAIIMLNKNSKNNNNKGKSFSKYNAILKHTVHTCWTILTNVCAGVNNVLSSQAGLAFLKVS